MIKIEITDPSRENPDTLVKLAAFLMECAGHTMVKASQEVKEKPGEKIDLNNPTHNFCKNIVQNLVEMAQENHDSTIDILKEIKEPIIAEKTKSVSKRKPKGKIEVIAETGITIIEEDLFVAPPPPVIVKESVLVNGNTLVDMILASTSAGKITRDDVNTIVRKHGLVAIKEIFTNDHLVPAIYADLEALMKG